MSDKLSLASVFVASLLGSLHCIGMCGGLVAISSTRSSPVLATLSYNFGRLLTYAFLGGIAGFIGKIGNIAGATFGFHNLATILISLVIIIVSTSLFISEERTSFLKKSLPSVSALLNKIYLSVSESLPKSSIHRSFATGFLSGLLPCGWLYGFVALAAASGSSLNGIILMFAFWVGTLPALFFSGVFLKSALLKFRIFGPILSSLILIGLAVYSLTTHWSPSHDHSHMSNDHSHHEHHNHSR